MIKNGKRVLFTVQGEGRGHLTQTITVQNILQEAGYEVCAVLVGTSSARQLPAFFYEQVTAPIIKFASPNFVTDAQHKSIRIFPSITFNLSRMPVYFRNMRMVNNKIKELKPDLVINFYDPLIGLYYLLYHPGVPMVCIAHQYTFLHPEFKFPSRGFFIEKIALKVFTWLTASRADKKLALSMYPLPDLDKKKIFVMPPLLRKEVFEEKVTQGNYILVYLLNSGYMEEIIKWHQANPEVDLHCFTDKRDIENEWRYDEKLCFHQINDRKFLELMAGCKAFASTAGFESVCEAMYLGKPVLMVPVEGHFEQYSNSRDAARAGAGLYDDRFNLDRLLAYLPTHQPDPHRFREWADTAREHLLHHLGEEFNTLATVPAATVNEMAEEQV